MATSFLSRWSKRKLEESSNLGDEEITPVEEEKAPASVSETLTPSTTVSLDNSEFNEATQDTTTVVDIENEQPEEMSIASLLVSEASESIKKTALRKLFLSEEFNVRDGLDDYDDDYSNLKSLSQEVAETLRDWVKEQTEEEPPEEITQAIDADKEVLSEDIKQGETSATTHQDETDSDKNTALSRGDTLEGKLMPEDMGQNIPHKQ
ncbi:uncharacterized protein DUF3306 [Vibrio sp. ES.051]|uniref:DUF3306 domain-containing protein n=1 Tax=Vibrio sp. ES.051 TaxID=1761909 RepID=UPI000BF81D91|nr:DUF3306 domain-containing protein [Vibrio sp. ES.051]PFG56120.1 uncharacterized protein DUF3306 [Vibrio sp. ES.051]